MKRICIMMVGLPGTGKSTTIKSILEKYPEMDTISTDEFIEIYAQKKGVNYSEAFKVVGDKADGQMRLKLNNLIKEKKPFIWDQTNVFASARKKKISMLKSNGYSVLAIVLEISDEEHKKRIEQRLKSTGKFVGEKIVENMRSGYERPTKEEGFESVILVKDGNVNVLESLRTGLNNGI